MARSGMSVDLGALARNWAKLDRIAGPGVETAAVVKANGYGLGAREVAGRLSKAGARSFFVALADEGEVVRRAAGSDAEIFVLSGHMDGDAPALREFRLTPLLNSERQFRTHKTELPGHPYGIQIDSGMNRLGMEPSEFGGMRGELLSGAPSLVMSHLACADEPDSPENRKQLKQFLAATDGLDARRSLAATAGMLLGPEYCFDLCRPGIGLYGGWPFTEAEPVVSLRLRTIQHRKLKKGEFVGYAASWRAEGCKRIATLACGYADGILRIAGSKAKVFADGIPCPLAGRISMDLLAADVSHLREVPDEFELLGPNQSIDDLATDASTIGHEILTCLGTRYERRYVENEP